VAECREHPVDELGPVRVLVGDPDPTCILGGALCDLPKTEEQRGVGEVERRCPGLTSCPEAPFGVLGEEVEDRLDPCFPVAASGAGVADEKRMRTRTLCTQASRRWPTPPRTGAVGRMSTPGRRTTVSATRRAAAARS